MGPIGVVIACRMPVQHDFIGTVNQRLEVKIVEERRREADRLDDLAVAVRLCPQQSLQVCCKIAPVMAEVVAVPHRPPKSYPCSGRCVVELIEAPAAEAVVREQGSLIALLACLLEEALGVAYAEALGRIGLTLIAASERDCLVREDETITSSKPQAGMVQVRPLFALVLEVNSYLLGMCGAMMQE